MIILYCKADWHDFAKAHILTGANHYNGKGDIDQAISKTPTECPVKYPCIVTTKEVRVDYVSKPVAKIYYKKDLEKKISQLKELIAALDSARTRVR